MPPYHPSKGVWLFLTAFVSQIRIAALNAASTTADESQDPQRSHKSQTKEAQVHRIQGRISNISQLMFMFFFVVLNKLPFLIFF